jgi:anti-anti-sigma factor
MFELMHAVRDGVLVLNPTGRLDSATCGAFAAGLADLGESAPSRIVLDLGRLAYISSAGLRVVLSAAKAAKEAGGALTLCGLHGDIAQVMAVSGFDEVLGAHATVDAAIASLKA